MRTSASAHGAAALDTLRELVGRLKSDDSLAPVTVVVRDNIAAITTRRALAHGVGERHGVAAINVTTLRRVADHLLSLGGSTLPPVTSARLTAVWRAELHAAPGVFELVAAHPATVRALARAHGELRGLDSTELATVAEGGPLAADLARLHGTVTGGVLAGRRDEAAVLRDATAMVDQNPEVAATLGAVILYLPDELDQLETAFLLSLDGPSASRSSSGRPGMWSSTAICGRSSTLPQMRRPQQRTRVRRRRHPA